MNKSFYEQYKFSGLLWRAMLLRATLGVRDRSSYVTDQDFTLLLVLDFLDK